MNDKLREKLRHLKMETLPSSGYSIWGIEELNQKKKKN